MKCHRPHRGILEVFLEFLLFQSVLSTSNSRECFPSQAYFPHTAQISSNNVSSCSTLCRQLRCTAFVFKSAAASSQAFCLWSTFPFRFLSAAGLEICPVTFPGPRRNFHSPVNVVNSHVPDAVEESSMQLSVVYYPIGELTDETAKHILNEHFPHQVQLSSSEKSFPTVRGQYDYFSYPKILEPVKIFFDTSTLMENVFFAFWISETAFLTGSEIRPVLRVQNNLITLEILFGGGPRRMQATLKVHGVNFKLFDTLVNLQEDGTTNASTFCSVHEPASMGQHRWHHVLLWHYPHVDNIYLFVDSKSYGPVMGYTVTFLYRMASLIHTSSREAQFTISSQVPVAQWVFAQILGPVTFGNKERSIVEVTENVAMEIACNSVP